MKKNINKKNNKNKKISNNYIELKELDNHMFLGLQLLCTLVVVILLIIQFINNKYLAYLEFSLAVDFFLMAYNNKIYYKRKNFSLYYIACGIFVLILFIIKIIGG